MAAWDISSAVSDLRSLLGDNATDKFEFKTDVFPTPDGITTRFFVGQTRLIESSLAVYVDHAATVSGAPSGVTEVDAVQGTFELGEAPSGNIEVQASFYYQWFTDPELTVFLNTAANMVAGVDVTSDALPSGLRAATLDFACYYAYMKKAAEYADSLVASAAGYTADQSKSHPNWRELAKTALDSGKKKLDIFVDNPLVTGTPQMRFVAYRLVNWQGP